MSLFCSQATLEKKPQLKNLTSFLATSYIKYMIYQLKGKFNLKLVTSLRVSTNSGFGATSYKKVRGTFLIYYNWGYYQPSHCCPNILYFTMISGLNINTCGNEISLLVLQLPCEATLFSGSSV